MSATVHGTTTAPTFDPRWPYDVRADHGVTGFSATTKNLQKGAESGSLFHAEFQIYQLPHLPLDLETEGDRQFSVKTCGTGRTPTQEEESSRAAASLQMVSARNCSSLSFRG